MTTIDCEQPAAPAATSPDPERWPGLRRLPQAPVRARIARAIFARAVRGLELRVALPGGRWLGGGEPDAPVMRVVREGEFFARLGADGKIGFGESYMVGAWEADDLPGVLAAFAARLTTLVPPRLQWLRRWYDARHPGSEGGDVAGARRNAGRHYDLSNELFALFLDPTMTYSGAMFTPEASATRDSLDGPPLPAERLQDAQLRKLDAILDAAGVGEGTRVLEIGSGWGSLAIRAARERGARVTTLTVSAEQYELTRRRVAEAGLADKVEVALADYREAVGRYDAVVSVEMIEAVGGRHWPVYFAALDRLLAPGGRVGLQAITMPHDRMLASRRSYTWVHKYIFPGGLIPSAQAIEEGLRRHTSLRVAGRRDLGADYARTLRRWRERFLARLEEVYWLGFDATFARMWEFYLAYSEAGFRAGYLGLSQFTLARSAGQLLDLSRRCELG